MKVTEIYSFDKTAERIEQVASELLIANEELRDAGRAWATKENEYRRAKAVAYLNAEGTIDARKAKVDQVCDEQRLAAHIAEAEREACLEKVRSLRAYLSSLQTLANVTMTEMNMASHPQPKW
jgi:hypothetical protein